MTLLATAVAVVLLISFRTPPPNASGTGASVPVQPSPSDSGGSAPASTPAPSPTPKSSGATSGTFTGQDYPNQFGDVKVQVVMAGGKITDIKVLQYPYDRARSAEISQQALPLLREEVLQAQSARIDILGGATFTSDSYAQSVQSALDQARA
ncbi:MAG: FMN-binding protein [Candidatus Dormibacteria bacterium]